MHSPSLVPLSRRAPAPATRAAALALALSLFAPAIAPALHAQERTSSAPDTVRFDDDGITFARGNGVDRISLGGRVQFLASASIPPGDVEGETELDAAIRRARLKLEGTLWDPRFGFSMELELAGEPDEPTGSVLDAVVAWQQTPNLLLEAGFTKLPGNRQRLVSSGAMQFADRSVVNATFTTDRDYLVMATYAREEATPWSWSGAVSAGEGRADAGPDMGLAYSTRVELQPLGPFTDGNERVEGDLAREPAPRLLLGAAVSHNDRAWRSRGQLGDELLAPRDLTTFFADATLKYRGWSLYLEGAHREAARGALPFVPGEDPRGTGGLVQLGYVTRGGWEPAVRLARVEMRDDTDASQASLNLTRYLRGHRIKYHLEGGREWGAAPGLRSRWVVRASLQAAF